MTEIKNCLITQSDAKVLREYCISKSSPLYQQYKGFNTSINLSATSVYNLYSGYVVMIPGDKKSGYEVVILINQNQAIKYSNLKSVDVKMHQQVDVSQKIGEARTYVRVEYLSTYVKNQFPFRVNSTQMYKDDPAKIIDPFNSYIQNESPQYNQSGLMGFVDEYDGGIAPSIEFELTGNRGV